MLLYLGSALLLARLASEAAMMYFERHLIYGTLYDRRARCPSPIPCAAAPVALLPRMPSSALHADSVRAFCRILLSAPGQLHLGIMRCKQTV